MGILNFLRLYIQIPSRFLSDILLINPLKKIDMDLVIYVCNLTNEPSFFKRKTFFRLYMVNGEMFTIKLGNLFFEKSFGL